jgi:hypothetical protein
MGTGGPFPGAKVQPGRETDHSPPTRAEVENEYELYLLSTQAPSRRVVGQLLCQIFRSWRRSVSVVSDYRLYDRVRSSAEAKDFSSSLCVQTNPEAHPTSYPVGIEGSFPGGKSRAGHDADHSPRSSEEVKNELEL